MKLEHFMGDDLTIFLQEKVVDCVISPQRIHDLHNNRSAEEHLRTAMPCIHFDSYTLAVIRDKQRRSEILS